MELKRTEGAYAVGPLRADDGIRTRDPNLGKVVLYQLSYSRRPARPLRGNRNRTVPGRVRPSVTSTNRTGMEARGIEPLTS